eukprot:Awhi_evm1s4833
MSLPLISWSVGHTCIYLIGDETSSTQPIPLFIRSGDALVMTGPSRGYWHGVPRIFKNTFPVELKSKVAESLWNFNPASDDDNDYDDNKEKFGGKGDVPEFVIDFITDSRLNMNVRY